MTAFPPGSILLLDMDGVLAEVSKSYRASIISTCHEHGATSITNDTVAEWKARGGCNNDWKLSFDLINTDPNGDKTVTYEQIVETFEKYYQGDGVNPGLCDLETLIPSIETLEELKKRCGENGMAVVTGRPKKDCEKFLKLYKIDHLFDCSVCMEDGPAKPDPFPVVRALELMGREAGKDVVMVGDTPDDIRAAIACGCRAVGVATPENVEKSIANGSEHDSCTLSVAMKECGADIVMKPGFLELLDVFPETR
mmetsp:Transcript_1322/g.2063  ORF Transcript_1322/g.2063 Transcript_1322/m.2063 type:complete len:253 (+) Transcript_1322:185-943(+)